MKPFLPLFSLLLVLASSCHFSASEPPELWFYTYLLSGKAGTDSSLTPASFICLLKDGHYTRDFGRFDHGRWTKKGNVLHLESSLSQSEDLPVPLEGVHEMQLQIGEKVANFEAQPGVLGEAAGQEQNPFSLGNNQWRIPPAAKESPAAIRRRLLNHFRFWERYFTWALDNHLTYADVRSTPTPIKIYGNGFTLKPFEELPAQWKACFFDAGDCRQASEIIRGIFQQRTIAWPHTDNRYKMFIGSFQQLEGFAEQE